MVKGVDVAPLTLEGGVDRVGFVLIGVLIFTVALVGTWMGYTPGPDTWRGHSSGLLLSRSVRAVYHGQVVFAARVGEGVVGLDCLIDARSGPESVRTVMEPVHVRAHGAMLFWAATSLDQVVLRWLDAGHQVSVVLVDSGERGMRAQVSRGDAFVVLDVIDRHEVDRSIATAQAATARPL
jgi:hypothetical protein